MSGRDTRSSPQADKRQMMSPIDESPAEKLAEAITALCNKRGVKTRIDNEGINDIDTGVHSDLRELKWTLMVGPALTPREGYSRRMLWGNRLVVHVVGLHWEQTKVKKGQSIEDVHEQNCLLSKESILGMKHISVLGMLGETVSHLGTVEACQDWINNHGVAMAEDGEPRFVKEMIDLSMRGNKWNVKQGIFSHLDKQ